MHDPSGIMNPDVLLRARRTGAEEAAGGGSSELAKYLYGRSKL